MAGPDHRRGPGRGGSLHVRALTSTVRSTRAAGACCTRLFPTSPDINNPMDTEQLLAPEDASRLGRSRADVLDMLRAADGPLGVREVAQRMGLHPNTARFHLEALTEAGLAVREAEDRKAP